MTLQFKQATLDNGLVVVGEIDAAAPTAAIGFFVKAGARDETTAEMGTSHFLEHMMFKGTDHRSAAQVDEHFDDIGAVHNAFTTSEMTAFYAHTLPEHVMEAESILADILRPALRDDDFSDEKKVILEEIAMYNDRPFWVLYERAMERYYRTHPLSHRVLGTKDTISALTCDQMRAYFNHRYSADNTVVALAGQVDFDQMVDRLRRDCGHWPRTN
ncbi:MAG: insulinase family protein, partial [Phycisphaerales bacterium]|nr:insulinase family protein [Phycisphaerales bacterium]